MKHPAIILMTLLAFMPLVAATGDAPAKHPQMSLPDRVTALEQAEERHERDDIVLQDHMTKHIDDILRSQGVQDEKIVVLQTRQQVVYATGELIAWVLALSIPIIVVYIGYRQKESKARHMELRESIKQFDTRLGTIESSLLVLHTQLTDHLKEGS